MKIWFTGEAGFIAKSFVKQFSETHEVINNINEYYDYWRSSLLEGSDREINVFDPILRKLIKDSGAEVIIHGAGIFNDYKCRNDLELAFRINVNGFINVCKIAQNLNIPLIYISALDIYGKVINPKEINFQFNPETIYGVTKVAAENFIKVYLEKYVTVVPGELYGKNDKNGSISKLFRSLEGSRYFEKINIDPESIKPFTYIDNFLDGLDIVLDNMRKLNKKRIHIASVSTSFEYVMNYMVEKLGLIPEYELYPDKDFYKNQYVDSDEIRKFGWKEKITMDKSLQLMGGRIIE